LLRDEGESHPPRVGAFWSSGWDSSLPPSTFMGPQWCVWLLCIHMLQCRQGSRGPGVSCLPTARPVCCTPRLSAAANHCKADRPQPLPRITQMCLQPRTQAKNPEGRRGGDGAHWGGLILGAGHGQLARAIPPWTLGPPTRPLASKVICFQTPLQSASAYCLFYANSLNTAITAPNLDFPSAPNLDFPSALPWPTASPLALSPPVADSPCAQKAPDPTSSYIPLGATSATSPHTHCSSHPPAPQDLCMAYSFCSNNSS
jgi:hypothetical protein